MKPNGTRVGYADALARECNNPWAAAYARTILEKDRISWKSLFLEKQVIWPGIAALLKGTPERRTLIGRVADDESI